MDQTRRLTVRIDEQYADAEAIEELTTGLRAELRALDADAERAGGGQAPPGTRAIELVALGTLIVTLAQSDVLAAVINAVSEWAGRNLRRSVRIELDGDVLELSGTGPAEQKQLTEAWLARRQPATARASGSRYALIVAGYEFQDPGLRRLRAPAHDAQALSQVLSDPAIGDFHVRTLLNEPAPVVNEAIEEFFADRKPDDVLLLHFSGHGVKDEEGELYFATAATKLNRLGATAVSADFVNRRMNRSRSRRIVLLLDCCYAGAFGRGMVPRAGRQMDIQGHFGGRGRAVITASNASEYAFEGADLADSDPTPSVFTSALVDGLRTGDADMDQDGFVGLDELYEYVYDTVRRTTPNQTPGKWTFDLQGELQIARRARPVTRPSALPAELQHAIDHPLAGVRAGAVTELARMLGARHGGMALAARIALERLSDDDSRDVSGRAAAALAAAASPATAVASRDTPTTAERTSTTAADAEPSIPATTTAPGMSGIAQPAPADSASAAPAKASVEPVSAFAEPGRASAEPVAVPRQNPASTQRSAPERPPLAETPAADRPPLWWRLSPRATLAWTAVIALLLELVNRTVATLPTELGVLSLRPRGSGLSLFYISALLPALVLLLTTRPGERTRRIAEGAVLGLAAGMLGMLYVASEAEGLRWSAQAALLIIAGVAGLAAVLVEPIRAEKSRLRRLLSIVAVVLAAGPLLDSTLPREDSGDVPDPVVIGITILVLCLLYLVMAFLRWRTERGPILLTILGAGTVLPLVGVLSLIDHFDRPALPAHAVIALVAVTAAVAVSDLDYGRLLALRLGAILSLLIGDQISDRFGTSGTHTVADLILLGMGWLAVATGVLAGRALPSWRAAGSRVPEQPIS